MNDLLGLALSPIVSCAAPVSRPLASSANSSIQKYSADRIQLPIVLDFHSDEGKQGIREWYHKQPTTRFLHVEHRKDTNGHFGHEFVVAYLDNSTVCRFDRRAREDMRGHALKNEGTISEDSAHVITQVDTESRAHLEESEVLMSVSCHAANDLEFILAVCYGIQSHPEAKSYSLLRYNCYFFSWTLLAIIDHQAHRSRVWESEWIERIANDWITGLCDRLAQEMAVSVNGSYQPFWESLTRLGRSTIGAIWYQESSILPVDDHIRKGMNRVLGDHFSKKMDLGPDKILFSSQISLWLKREVFSTLQKGAQLGVQQFLAETNAQSQTNGKLSTPVPPTNMNFGETDRLDGNTSSVLDMDQTYRSLEERAQRQAETERMRYDEAIDTFIANSSYLSIWSGARWSHSSAVYKHVTKRMMDHFEQVESYGFGKAEPSIRRAEDSMTEIWVSALDMLKNKSKLSFLVDA